MEIEWKMYNKMEKTPPILRHLRSTYRIQRSHYNVDQRQKIGSMPDF